VKTLVTFFSQTGNTKLIAEKMHAAISTKVEADIGTVRSIDLDILDKYAVIFVGAPCHDSDLAPPVKGFLDRLPEAPKFKLAGFFTHATNMPDSKRNKQLYDQWAGRCIPSFEDPCKSKNIEYLGTFHCQGKASEPIEHFIHQEIITDEDEWNEYLPEMRVSPNKNDLENAEKFALDIINNL
jgi:flavodoxin